MLLKEDICRHDALAASVHHANPWGVSQPVSVGMMLECSTGELLTSACSMTTKGHDALRHYAILKGLTEFLVQNALYYCW